MVSPGIHCVYRLIILETSPNISNGIGKYLKWLLLELTVLQYIKLVCTGLKKYFHFLHGFMCANVTNTFCGPCVLYVTNSYMDKSRQMVSVIILLKLNIYSSLD